MTGACKDCRFSQDFDGAGFHECRRHAPWAGVSRDATAANQFAVWPMVAGRHWCGDFKEAEPAKPRGRPRKYAQGPQHREAPPRPIRDSELSGVTA